MYDDQQTNAMEPVAPSVSQTNTEGGAARPAGRLDAIVENLSTRAAPVVREIAARSAELAAKAGEAAGPLAHRAAEKTEAAGGRFADRSREFATDLRREATSASPRSADPSPSDSV
jgi:hypothetical protein